MDLTTLSLLTAAGGINGVSLALINSANFISANSVISGADTTDIRSRERTWCPVGKTPAEGFRH